MKMGARWKISRNKLFGYALDGVRAKKDEAFENMVNSKEANDIESNSREYIRIVKDFDAICELIDRELDKKPVAKKEGRKS